MRSGVSLHDVSEFHFLSEFDVLKLSELGAVLDHGVVGGEAHEVVDEAKDDQTNSRRRRVNVNRTVLRLVAILLEILTANARVVVALDWSR